MKFSNGYWELKPEITACYAAEYFSGGSTENEITLYTSTRHMQNRGALLNNPLITLKISSPMDNVIKISAVHHDGAYDRGPGFEKYISGSADVSVREDQESICLKSADLSAVISKAPERFSIRFFESASFESTEPNDSTDLKQRLITEAGRRSIGYMKNNASGRSYMQSQLSLDVGEYIYGLGERFTPFVKNGQTVDIWNEDGATGSELAYKNIPFYISNKGYGVFVDNPGDVSFEIGSENVERCSFSIEGERLDYYIIYGPAPRQILTRYTALTGRPALPPAWSFGLWLSTSFTTNYDEDTTNIFIDGMAERGIPLSVFHFDCFWMKSGTWCDFNWDETVFPNPSEILSRYKEKGLKICVWINPYIGQMSPLFYEAKDRGYLIRKKDGGVWQTDKWQPGMGIVDFTNPEACKWYKEMLNKLMDMGVDTFKTDFGERIPVRDIKYFDGSDPVRMHNYYAYLYNRLVFESLEEFYGKNNAAVFARSAAVGCQKFPVHWGGDSTAKYNSMAETLRGGLSLSLAGFGFWSHDIGGFDGADNDDPADLYKRWCAFGLLSSHSRLHGASSYRVPWVYDDEASEVLREFTRLKMRLMPYIFAKAVESHETGVPVMRPMFFEFFGDKVCEHLDLQYMLGDSLLVAPVFSSDKTVSYYLPKGVWTNFFTGEKIIGERYITEKHGYFTLPLMVRPNTVLPVGNRGDRPDYDYTDGLSFYLYEIESGAEIETIIYNTQSTCDLRQRVAVRAITTKGNGKITVRLSKNIGEFRVIIDGKEYKSGGMELSIDE